MIEIKMTEYTIEIPSCRKTIKVYGDNTEENQEKAEDEFIRQIKSDINSDWLWVIDVKVDTDYECGYKEAI